MTTFKEKWLLKESEDKFSKRFLTKTPSNINIYLIDGKYVRNHFEVDFIGGGHFLVPYKFIPENEIWIEDLKKGKSETNALILHEFIERMLMKYMNFGYEDGHKKATYYETLFRKIYNTNKNSISMILNEFFKKYFTNDKFYNKEFADNFEKNLNKGE